MNSDEFLKKYGIRIDPTNECALDVDNALKYVEYLKKNGKIILGGDVYEKDKVSGELIPTCNNWYLSDDDLDVEKGYKYSKEYIRDYPNKNNNIYFVIVTSSLDKIKERRSRR